MVQNLWPEDLGSDIEAKAPVTILREQAWLLGNKTKNLVEAEVTTSRGSFRPREFGYTFFLVAPALGGYRYDLFSIFHNIPFYPVLFEVGGELKAEITVDESQEITANSEAEFTMILKRIFNSSRTQQVIGALLAQMDQFVVPSETPISP